MVSSNARSPWACAKSVFFVVCFAAQLSTAQSNSPSLTPGQTKPQAPASNQPGKVSSGSGTVVQTVPDGSPDNSTVSAAAAGQPVQPPTIFESHGLEYETLTRNGITVMFASLPSRLKDFNIVQITITNGSLVSWTAKPSDFAFVRQDNTTLTPVSADDVVQDLLEHANRDDVIKLQLLYENSIYALSSNYRSTNGYEKRREAAMAQFVNRGFKAAAEASALAFIPTKLKSGDSTDGAVFFPNHSKEKGLGTGRLVAHTCGEIFIFETYGEFRRR